MFYFKGGETPVDLLRDTKARKAVEKTFVSLLNLFLNKKNRFDQHSFSSQEKHEKHEKHEKRKRKGIFSTGTDFYSFGLNLLAIKKTYLVCH